MTTSKRAAASAWLAYFPVTFFAVAMGLAGLTLAIGAAQLEMPVPDWCYSLSYMVTIGAFALITLTYVVKAVRHPADVIAEWGHPVRMAFFPAISISLLLLSAASLGNNEDLARFLWLIAAMAQAVLTIAVVSGWIGSRSFQTGHISPAWFIPAVGNVIAPIAGVPLGYFEPSWYFMSVGLMFWVVLLTLVINRLIFHDPLPGRLQPTLVILIAPPAVAFLAWTRLYGEVDAFARFLLNAAYFFTLIVAVQLPKILRLPFALSHWALSFPFAAVTSASFVFAANTGSSFHRLLGIVLLTVLLVIISGLMLRTVKALVQDEIFHPE